MFPTKCDADGNLTSQVRYRPAVLGPIVKIDPEGKRVAFFDPVAVPNSNSTALTPSPAPMAASTRSRLSNRQPQITCSISSDGFSSPIHLDADFQPSSRPFCGGNLLLSGFSGIRKTGPIRDDHHCRVSADGRMWLRSPWNRH